MAIKSRTRALQAAKIFRSILAQEGDGSIDRSIDRSSGLGSNRLTLGSISRLDVVAGLYTLPPILGMTRRRPAAKITFTRLGREPRISNVRARSVLFRHVSCSPRMCVSPESVYLRSAVERRPAWLAAIILVDAPSQLIIPPAPPSPSPSCIFFSFTRSPRCTGSLARPWIDRLRFRLFCDAKFFNYALATFTNFERMKIYRF